MKRIKFDGYLELPDDLFAGKPSPSPEPIPEPKPKPDPEPVPKPEPPTNPPIKPPHDSNEILLEDYNSFEQALSQPGKTVVLQPGKVYYLDKYQTTSPERQFIKGEESIIITGINAPRYMFAWDQDNPEFGIKGVSIWQSPKVKFKPNTKTCILFFTAANRIKTGKLAYINARRPPKDQLSHQLFWGYSGQNGDNDQYLHVIAKNVQTNGSEFLTAKANNGGGLLSTLIDVDIFNSDVYNPNYFRVNGSIGGGLFTLDPDSNDLVSDIKTHYGYHNLNVRTILHIGRFVFNIKEKSVFNDRAIALGLEESPRYIRRSKYSVGCRLDLQAGDVTTLGRITKKQILHPWREDPNKPTSPWVEYYWEYFFDREIAAEEGDLKLIQSSFNLSGSEEAYLIYKGNMMFSDPGLTERSQYGDWYILLGKRYGHTMYNHANISAYWENVKMTGFYRQSSPDNVIGNSQGYSLKNIHGFNGQFAPPVKVDKPIDPEVLDFLQKIERL